MRFVPDTNVLFSAAISRGLCFEIIADGIKQQRIFLSEYILDELAEVLARKSSYATDEQAGVIAYFRKPGVATLVAPAGVPAAACPDSKDLQVLGTAITAKAEYLVTGDRHLLELKKYRGIRIVSPREFLQHTVGGK